MHAYLYLLFFFYLYIKGSDASDGTADFVPENYLNCGLMTIYGDIHLGQRWFDAWLHQVINYTNVYLSSIMFCGIHLRAIL